MDQALLYMITNQTFAIVIATYLVWWITKKLNGKMDKLANSIDRLNMNIEALINVINNRRGKKDGE